MKITEQFGFVEIIIFFKFITGVEYAAPENSTYCIGNSYCYGRIEIWLRLRAVDPVTVVPQCFSSLALFCRPVLSVLAVSYTHLTLPTKA